MFPPTLNLSLKMCDTSCNLNEHFFPSFTWCVGDCRCQSHSCFRGSTYTTNEFLKRKGEKEKAYTTINFKKKKRRGKKPWIILSDFIKNNFQRRVHFYFYFIFLWGGGTQLQNLMGVLGQQLRTGSISERFFSEKWEKTRKGLDNANKTNFGQISRQNIYKFGHILTFFFLYLCHF